MSTVLQVRSEDYDYDTMNNEVSTRRRAVKDGGGGQEQCLWEDGGRLGRGCGC